MASDWTSLRCMELSRSVHQHKLQQARISPPATQCPTVCIPPCAAVYFLLISRLRDLVRSRPLVAVPLVKYTSLQARFRVFSQRNVFLTTTDTVLKSTLCVKPIAVQSRVSTGNFPVSELFDCFNICCSFTKVYDTQAGNNSVDIDSQSRLCPTCALTSFAN